MQDLRDERLVDQDLSLEIRSRPSSTPTSATDLRRLGVALLESSRLLYLQDCPLPLEERHLSVLANPLLEHAGIDEWGGEAPFVDVFCRPGVTDAEGDMAALALSHVGIPHLRCRAGTRHRFANTVPAALRGAVERALGNPLIHRFLWSDDPAARIAFAAHDVPPGAEGPRRISLAGAGDQELLTISRSEGLALDLTEMMAVRSYFDALRRQPTDVELQSIALTWSEHCSHKTFKATIEMEAGGRRETIHGLLATCIAEPARMLARPWVRSAFVDNAGIIMFDQQFDLAFKVETHNHPSALEPYGGAHTGVGGVIRDILAVSAEPIANTDVLCFGPPNLPAGALPAGALPPGTTCREVVRGVADYGNNMGIPTVGGGIFFNPGYTANPLVYCGTLGILPHGSHPTAPRPSDTIVVLGGRTGRDGLHGATMSSETLDRETVASSTVQIGAPITEKVLRDVLPHLRDERLYHAITDCGAGGLCSAVGEMGEALGVEVDLALVPLKYEGLSPWEIWLSEAQERLILAVPPENLPRVFSLCRANEVEATVLGRFRDDGVLRLRYGDEVVAEMTMAFLHGGRPERVLHARWGTAVTSPGPAARAPSVRPEHGAENAAACLLALLAHPNIASKESVIRRYDHEVGAGTVIKPLVGRAGPSDAAVLRPLSDSWRGAALSHGMNPLYGMLDPHAMALLAVDEALRNLVAVGGSLDSAALLDNFCWGDVDGPEGLGALVRAAQGCRDAALRYEVPFICGKDSLRNTSVDAEGIQSSIPGTLLVSAVGVVEDVRRCVSMDLKRAGSYLYLLGATADELGGSHLHDVLGIEGGVVPRVRSETPAVMRRLTRAIEEGHVLSCHDLSEGGLAVAAAEMALAGGLGLSIDLDRMPAHTGSTAALLFSESPGRFLIEVGEDEADDVEHFFEGLPLAYLGLVTDDARLRVNQAGMPAIDLSVADLDAAWRTPPVPDLSPGPEAEVTASSGGVPSRQYGSGVPSPLSRPGVRALILTAPGVNCDRETVEACRMAGAEAELVHLQQLLQGDRRLADFGMLVLPGGFSYGDHLGAGTMLATVLQHCFQGDLERFVVDGRPVLGICNGFQVLARLGLLGPVALAPNSSSHFDCRWVRLRVEPSSCPYLDGLEDIELPIAHGQGRVVTPEETVEALRRRAPLRYIENPNGSVADIAAVCSERGNVLGLMPHPERYLTPYHHPDRSHRPPAGLDIFRNVVRAVEVL